MPLKVLSGYIVFNVITASAARRGCAAVALVNAAAFGVYDGSTFSTCHRGSLCDHGNHRNYKEGNDIRADFTVSEFPK